MGLSNHSIGIASDVMQELGLFGYNWFTPDFRYADEREKKHPRVETTYGIDQKCDNSWEELFFFIKNPSDEFIEKWNKLRGKVKNSSYMKKYEENPGYMQFGWF